MASKIQIIVEAVDKASKDLKKIGQETNNLVTAGQSIAGGFSTATAGIGLAIIAISKIKKELDDVVKLSEKQPELFSDQQLANIQAYDDAAQDLNNTFQELKITTAAAIAPTFTAAMEDTNQKIKEQGVLLTVLKFGFDDIFRYLFKAEDAYVGAADAVDSYDRAIMNQQGIHIQLREQLDDTTNSVKAQEQALRLLSNSYKDLLSSTQAIDRESQNFADREAARAEQLKRAQEEKVRLQIQLNNIRAAGNSDIQTENRYALQQIELDQKIAELSQQRITDEQEKQKASKQRIFDLALEQAAQDGLSSAEFERFQNLQVQLGLVSRESANMAIAERQAADEFAQALSDPNEELDKLRENMNRFVSGSPYIVDVIINTMGGIPSFAALPGGATTPANQFEGGVGFRAAGGPVMTNQAYLVGERGPEMFVPNQNGNIIPNDKMGGATINVYATVRNDNDINYIAQEVARRIA